MDYNSEAGFLQNSFVEFVKCWSMGTNSVFHVESRNGEAFFNFQAYLGSPQNVHFYQPNQKRKSKSETKTKRDNERAALFQAKMNKSRISSSSTPKMKSSDISDTTNTNTSERTNDIVENKASDTTSDTTSDNIPDDVSESDTIVPSEDDDNQIESQSNEPLLPASINNQPSVNTENSVTNSTCGERSNFANQIATHDRHLGFTAPAVAPVPVSTPASAVPDPDPPLSEYEVNRIIQIAAANGMKIGPQQVPAFLRLYNMFDKQQ